MKRLILSVGIAALAAGAANATHFTFTDTLNGGVVTGSFDGDLSGNLITNLSNASVSLNGNAYTNPLYIEQYGCGTYGFCDGGVASLDGTQNNVLFINSDYANGDFSYTQYFYSLPTSGNGDYAYDLVNYQFASGYPLGTFSAQVAGVPEPASWALMVGGFGAIGGALRSRRKAAVSFG